MALLEKPFQHLEGGEVRPVVGTNRDRPVLELLGLVKAPLGPGDEGHPGHGGAQRDTIFAGRCPDWTASTVRFITPHSHIRYWSRPPRYRAFPGCGRRSWRGAPPQR